MLSLDTAVRLTIVGNPEIRYAQSGEVNIAYATIGDGPVDVVLVTGWILSNLVDAAWDGPSREMYERLSSFCRLIVFDKRGTGLSDRSAGIPTLETRMDDIRAVMDAVGSQRAALIGVSEGGPLTMLFAAAFPERTAAIALYGTGASWRQAADYPWALTPDEAAASLDRVSSSAADAEWVENQLSVYAPSHASSAEMRAWWRRWVHTSASPGAMIAHRRMNLEIDARHVLPSINVPALVLHRVGDEDVQVEEGRYVASRIAGSTFVELAGVDHGWWVGTQQVVEPIEAFFDDIRRTGQWDLEHADQVLTTVLFTDIVGSTEKLAEVGDRRWRDLVTEHHAVVRRQLVRFGGREVDTAGDGFFASFDGPARGIRCACAILDSVRSGTGLELRAGLHSGECEIVDGKLGGLAVHIGARVAGQAGGGEVLVSSTVRDLVAGSGIALRALGRRSLKGLPDDWLLYRVDRDGEARS